MSTHLLHSLNLLLKAENVPSIRLFSNGPNNILTVTLTLNLHPLYGNPEPQALKGWSKGGPSWDPKQPNGAGLAEFRQTKAPDIQFVKRRTPATGATPSQIVYAVRVDPKVRAMSAPPDLKQLGGHSGGDQTSVKKIRKNKSKEIQLTEWEIKIQNSRLEKEEKRRADLEHSRYQDQVLGFRLGLALELGLVLGLRI